MKALLVIDMLNDFIEDDGALPTGEAGKKIITFISEQIAEFRRKGYPVVYVCDNHEKDDGEFEMFTPHCIANTRGAAIIDQLAAAAEDKVILKRRYSAFFGTDLDLYLREKGVDQIYLVGVNTNICVLYTAADARNINYKVHVFEQGVASFDDQAHHFALRELGSTLGCSVL